MQEFDFRGHDERESSINKGDFKELAEVITPYGALPCISNLSVSFLACRKQL
jgi:hypothetical protein